MSVSSSVSHLQYQVPINELSVKQLQILLERDGVANIERYTTLESLCDLARSKGRDSVRLRGMAALETKASEFIILLSRLEKSKVFEADRSLGLSLKRIGEWAVVLRAPRGLGICVGDIIVAVDGRRTLLESYETMFTALRRARTMNTTSFRLTFRRAPFHRGWLFKYNEASSFFSNRFQKFYFVCGYGVLAYFNKDPARGGKQKGFFPLSSSADGFLATLSTQVIKGDTCLLLERGTDRLVIKSKLNDIHNWAALLYVAIAHANGGNELMRRHERKSQEQARAFAPRNISRTTRSPPPPPSSSRPLGQAQSETKFEKQEAIPPAPPLPPIVLSVDPLHSSMQSPHDSTVLHETATFYHHGASPTRVPAVDPAVDPALDDMSRQASIRLEAGTKGREPDIYV